MDFPGSADQSRDPKRRRLNNEYREHTLSHLPTPDADRKPFISPGCYEENLGTHQDDILIASPRAPGGWSSGVGGDSASVPDWGYLECCYGMLSAIPVMPKSASSGLYMNSTSIPVLFDGPKTISSRNTSVSIAFEIPELVSSILHELGLVVQIGTQIYCYGESHQLRDGLPQTNSTSKHKSTKSWYMNVIVYGPSALQNTVGDFLSRHQMYLQDPLSCDRNVPYCNPHNLSSESGDVLMTDEFKSATTRMLEVEQLKVAPDLLSQLMEDEVPLPETEAPPVVKTKLFPHQKQALTFMLYREQGEVVNESDRDIWTKQKTNIGQSIYRNNVNGSHQLEPPPIFRGGLLADDMGLGKTLSMISLIAANPACNLQSPPITPKSFGQLPQTMIKTTLLVVPPPLMQAWEKQLNLHIQPTGLKWHNFHGRDRKELEYLKQYDIVITTYQTISAIWRREDEPGCNPKSIFHPVWHRVILDEAHTIQNIQSHLAQACCALQSMSRWAITGTPIQNKLTDFSSILKFLQVYPYSNRSILEEEIFKPWQCGDPQGFLKLKKLVRAITISRTKAVVDLPQRIDQVHHLDFTLAEREAYDAAKKETVMLLEDAMASGNKSGTTFNALQRLNALRLFCNHGLLVQSTQTISSAQEPDDLIIDFQKATEEEFIYGRPVISSTFCIYCGIDILEDLLEGSPSHRLETQLHISHNENGLCQNCSSQMNSIELGKKRSYHCDQPTDRMLMSPSQITFKDKDRGTVCIESMSTKIKALVIDLLDHQGDEKSVVFSFWTYTLDLVQLMLDNCGISYTRIDGKLSLTKRTEALRAFHTVDSLRVILVSITCGGTGLDLTAASRAYLIEPHWNPMVEEQALCRVHRVGQKRKVTTIRYLMRDSFEEQVVEIQKRKKMLAKVTFGNDPLSENGIGVGTLQYLKSVLQ